MELIDYFVVGKSGINVVFRRIENALSVLLRQLLHTEKNIRCEKNIYDQVQISFIPFHNLLYEFICYMLSDLLFLCVYRLFEVMVG